MISKIYNNLIKLVVEGTIWLIVLGMTDLGKFVIGMLIGFYSFLILNYVKT